MANYSDSTKALFARSENKEIRKRAGFSTDKSPDYYGDSSEEVPVAKFKNQPGYLFMDLTSTSVIGMFGGSGAGKTTADVSILGRAFKQGRIPINFADTDLQFTNFDNNGGVSKKLKDQMGFYEGEERFEIEQKTLMPKYLYNKLEKKPTNVEVFTLGFSDINESEVKFLLGQGLDTNQKESLQTVLNNVGFNSLSDSARPFDLLRDALEESETIHHSVKNKLKRNIDNLDDGELISNRYRKDITGFVKKGMGFSMGLKNFQFKLDESEYYKMEFYAKRIFTLIIKEKLEGDLDRPLFGVLPEAHHLMPRGGDSILADILKRNFTFYKRRTDFPFILDSQEPSNLPSDIMRELNHVFIGCDEHGKPLDKNEFKKILDAMSVVANPQRDNSRWISRLQELNHREFLYINGSMSDPSEGVVVEFLAPPVSNP